jgi:hypothetical protein
MMIILSQQAYMKVTGCTARQMKYRIKAKVLRTVQIHPGIASIIYETDAVENPSKSGRKLVGLRPSYSQVLVSGVDFHTLNTHATDNSDSKDTVTIELKKGGDGDRFEQELRKNRDMSFGFVQADKALGEAMEHIIKEPAATPKTAGHVNLHRRLLAHDIMDNPVLSACFVELMLLANLRGEIDLTRPTKLARAQGALSYASALATLEKVHGVITVEASSTSVRVRILKWLAYQPDTSDINTVVIRDRDNPDVEIKASPGDDVASSPTPPSSNTILTNISNIIPSEAGLKEKEIGVDNIEREEETTREPEKKTRKRREHKIKMPRDPYKLEDFEPQYRPFVKGAHEVYEYYKKKIGAPSTRLTAVDKIIPLLMLRTQDELISAIDNYYADHRRKGQKDTYLRSAQSFFNDFYAGYLPDELPIKHVDAPQERRRRKENAPNVEVIRMTPKKEGE